MKASERRPGRLSRRCSGGGSLRSRRRSLRSGGHRCRWSRFASREQDEAAGCCPSSESRSLLVFISQVQCHYGFCWWYIELVNGFFFGIWDIHWTDLREHRKAMGFSTKGGSCKSALKPIRWDIGFEYSSIFMLHSGSTQETHSPSTSWQKCKCHKTPRSNGGHTGQDLELRLGKSLDWVVPYIYICVYIYTYMFVY